MFGLDGNYYYFIIALQALCAWHCLRRGNQGKWIWIIVFLPMLGCIIYIFSEVISGHELRKTGLNLGAAINPGGRIRELEKKLEFSDTFNNRILLADAYLLAGRTDQAIGLYESSLTGLFDDNEHAITQLIHAYSEKERFADIVKISPKVYRSADFGRSRAHILYAIALEKTGDIIQAEKEFMLMNGRFSNFEGRYHYGLFLKRNKRTTEASALLRELLEESSHLNGREQRDNRIWFRKAKEELQRID